MGNASQDGKEVNLANLNNWALSIEAFRWIRNHIPDNATIIEFGSGTGTIELARFYTVYTVEQNIEFVGKAVHAHYIHAPLAEGWYDADVVFTNLPTEYSLVIVDGPIDCFWNTPVTKEKDSTIGCRRGMDAHLSKFRTDVPFLFDDTHREYDRSHAILVAASLNRPWHEEIGWQKNFIIVAHDPLHSVVA